MITTWSTYSNAVWSLGIEFPLPPYMCLVPPALQLGKREKVGEHDAQVVEYQLTCKVESEKNWKGSNATLAVKLWLDVKTGLPLKRSITGKIDNIDEIAITETYTKFVIDEKIDEKRFELPK